MRPIIASVIEGVLWEPLSLEQRKSAETWLNANLAGIRLILDEHVGDGVNAVANGSELSQQNRRALKHYMLKRLGESLCAAAVAQ